AVALLIAVPLGVCSATYVSEVAARGEKSLIKPYIEFISAIPSVVLGFFGIAVVGQAVRALSQMPFMKWVPFFPISERLNVFPAGAHYDRHHRAGNGRSSAWQHPLSGAFHGRTRSFCADSWDQLSRAKIGRALPDEYRLI